MSNYNSLKTTINANVKQNGRQEITGQILNSVLNAMVNTLGAGYQFAGVATTAIDPGSPDAKVFYIANGKGTYTNFGGISVTEDDVVVLYWDSSWHKVSTGIASMFDVTDVANRLGKDLNLSTYESQKYYDDNGTWKVGLASYTGFIVPCKEGQIFLVRTQENIETNISFVQNAPVNNAPIQYASGGSRTRLEKNQTHILTAPVGTNYLWVSSKSGSNINMPVSVTIQSEFLKIGEQFLSDDQKTRVLNNFGIEKIIEQAEKDSLSINGILGTFVGSSSNYSWKVWKSGISLKRGNLYKINVALAAASDVTKYFYLSDAVNDSGVKYIRANVSAGSTTGYGYLYAQEDVEGLNIISLGTFSSAEVSFTKDTLDESIDKLLSNSVLVTPVSFLQEEQSVARSNIGLSVVKDGEDVIEADGYVKSDGTYGSPTTGWKRSGKIAIDTIFDDVITLSSGTSGDLGRDAVALAAYDDNDQVIGFIRYGFSSVAKNTLPVGTKYIALSFYQKQSCIITNANLLDGLINLNKEIEGIENPVTMDYLAKKDKVEQIGYIRASSDPKPLLFMHVSDTHGSVPLGFIEQMKFAVSCLNDLSVNRTNKNNNVKFLLHTGDIHRSNPKGTDSDYTYFENAAAEANKPVFVAVGNHDVGESSLVANSATNIEVYNQMIAPMLTSWGLKTDGEGVPHPQNANYYFTDFTDEKVRLIVLYEFESDFEIDPTDSTKLVANRSVRSFSQTQINWLINSLLTTPAGYGVIIAKHQPEATLGSTDNPFSSPYTRGLSPMFSAVDKKMICEIVDAFMNGTTISKSYAQTAGIVTTLNVSADFSQKNAGTEFICYCSGHLHCDSVNFIQEFPSQLELNIGVDNDIRNYTSGSDMMQLKTTKSENLINVYSIDRLRGLIHIVRIGADFSNSGQDRTHTTINYK